MNPLTMCVMDDIQTVVKGIASTIPWPEHRIEVVGTAGNGEQGWELLLEKDPDIVISDIRMPKLSGLALMKRAADRGLRAKFIFISGYSDFSYAQEAVKLGASDYLLKPFTPPEILNAVLKVKSSIEADRAKSEQLVRLEQNMVASRSQLRQDYLTGLLRQETDARLKDSRWQELGIELDSGSLLVMAIEMDCYTEYGYTLRLDENEIIPFAVKNIVDETLKMHTRGVVLRESKQRLAAIFNPPEGMDTAELLELCRENVEKFSKNTVSIGLGTMARGPREIRTAFVHAAKALAYRFYSEGNCIFRFTELAGDNRAAPGYPEEKEKELLYALKSGNEAGCHEIISDIFRQWTLTGEYPDPLSMVRLLTGLAFAMYRAFCDEITEEERIQLEADLMALEENRSLTFGGWKSYIDHFSSMGCEFVEKNRLRDVTQSVNRAREYIRLHLEENLTLNSCAQAVHLSPSYFANAFKKETGMTLIQYITKMRMERAKELLIAGAQVQEISLMLGYEDRPYFSGLFKKYCGMTPTAFRQKYLK
ncbi:helix-turn-helix domain-containing protein [Paenibacillus sp. MMS20-IR301]|uniref:helix-turn-helix domain-containing protein n=1 Tax=Paenibacillus sp. MMS20-IR301 TaxID=2895946 RepID=UPI0028E68A9C|nr:helix-turn-helix domain-containing protein [Paenibacillus sp. MMS20-IR301]WNS43757.1 response regulator [Paenibacillus sp. MMS20-IR301]